MITISDFKVNLNKTQVINVVKSYFNEPTEKQLSSAFDLLLPILEKNIKPIGLYKIEKTPKNINIAALKNYDFLVYCLVTVGDEITDIIENLFSEGKINEAVLLDAMASSYLFEVSSQLFKHVYNTVKTDGLGLSYKIAPGDGEVDILYQKEILNKLEKKSSYGITLIDDFLLYPSKSMSYIYGADKSIPLNLKDHSCLNCNNKFCTLRNLSSDNKKIS